MNCPKCKSNSFCKNGIVRGHQRYFCLKCKFNFTELTDLNKPHPDSKPREVKKLAHKLYLKGCQVPTFLDTQFHSHFVRHFSLNLEG